MAMTVKAAFKNLLNEFNRPWGEPVLTFVGVHGNIAFYCFDNREMIAVIFNKGGSITEVGLSDFSTEYFPTIKKWAKVHDFSRALSLPFLNRS